MKTSLQFIALFTTLSVPAALALEFAGVNLPAAADLGTAFGLFIVSLVALTVATDYARASQPRLVAALTETKATNPLAA